MINYSNTSTMSEPEISDFDSRISDQTISPVTTQPEDGIYGGGSGAWKEDGPAYATDAPVTTDPYGSLSRSSAEPYPYTPGSSSSAEPSYENNYNGLTPQEYASTQDWYDTTNYNMDGSPTESALQQPQQYAMQQQSIPYPYEENPNDPYPQPYPQPIINGPIISDPYPPPPTETLPPTTGDPGTGTPPVTTDPGQPPVDNTTSEPPVISDPYQPPPPSDPIPYTPPAYQPLNTTPVDPNAYQVDTSQYTSTQPQPLTQPGYDNSGVSINVNTTTPTAANLSGTAVPVENTANIQGLALPTNNVQTGAGNMRPVTQTVGGNELVSNQMNNLLAENSKYMRLARSGAAQQANSRGLMNSSIAAGAGENAAIRSALPIAQQDAATYNSTNTNNTNWSNKFGENKQQHGFGMERDAANADYRNQNTQLQGEIQNQLAEAQAAFRRGEITQQGLIAAQQAAANAGYRQDEITQQGDISSQLAGQQHGYNLDRDNANANYQQDNLALQQQYTQDNLGMQNAYTQANMGMQNAYDIEQMDAAGQIQHLRDVALNSMNLHQMDQQQAYNLETQATAFANQMQQNAMQMSANNSANYLASTQSLMQGWSQEVQAIYNNSNMSPQQQNAALEVLRKRYEGTPAYGNYPAVPGLIQMNNDLWTGMGTWDVMTDTFPPSP